jgi:phosphoribosylformylglycinamidine synthase
VRFAFEVLVSLKPGLADPQGRAVESAMPALGWTNVTGVRVGKHVALSVEAASEDEARRQVEDMAARLLSNPVIEDFKIVGDAPGTQAGTQTGPQTGTQTGTQAGTQAESRVETMAGSGSGERDAETETQR